jgi:hypothetical protein
MEQQSQYTSDEILKADTILRIEKDILGSMLKNLNAYVETAESISDRDIIPIMTSSLVMSIKSLEKAFNFDVGSMIVELINIENKKKLN